MNNEGKDNKMQLGMFRTKHLLILQSNDFDTFLVFLIPKKYIEKKALGTAELKDAIKKTNGSIVMCPDGVRFVLHDVNEYYDEATEGFRKKVKEKGYDVFLEPN